MTVLSVSDIRLEYGTDVILQKINFSINEGDRLGIVGVNGAGKSTLLRIIAGMTEPSGGNVYIAKGKTVGMLEQNAMLESDKTLTEEMANAFSECQRIEKRLAELQTEIEAQANAPHDESYERLIADFTRLTEKFREIGGYEYKSRIRSMLTRFGFPESEQNKTIDTLSGGERTRLALVRLLLVEPDILILDEPTNHLDTDTLYWLEEHLRAYPKTLLLVSHDRYFLDRTATKILDIENTKAELYTGNYSAFATQKLEARKRQQKMYDLQQKEIARIEGIIQTQIHFGQEHNYITIASKKKQIEHMDKVDAPENAPGHIRLAFAEAAESGNDVLEADSLAKSFGTKKLFEDVSFMVKKKDHVIIMGPNGCGKSTLIKILGGFIDADGGAIEYGTGVIAGYYDQEQAKLDESKTIFEEISDSYPTLTQGQIRNMLAAFVFTGDDVFKPISALSGGEKGRVSLAKIMLSKANTLMLDEPTNHLDMFSKEVLESAITRYEGTCIYISHDRYFINKTAEKILELTPDGVILYNGNYDYYLEKKAERARNEAEKALQNPQKTTASAPAQPISETKNDWLKQKEQQAAERKLANKIKKVETEIEETEAAIAQADEDMAACGTDFSKANEIFEQKTKLEEKLEKLFEEWEELHS